MNGGSGVDGQTQLAWLDSVEMGGTLLLEAQGVTLAAASTGLLAAFFSGPQTIAGCVAGFQAAAQHRDGRGDGAAHRVRFGGGEHVRDQPREPVQPADSCTLPGMPADPGYLHCIWR